jgi:diacylglycerol kinase
MSKFKCQGYGNTFKNARKGIRLALRAEECIKVHYVVALAVLALAVLLGFSAEKICILILTIGFVIITEMVNSAIEFSLDAVFKNKYSKMVGIAKDIAAGAVLFATVQSIVIGLLLFIPAIIELFD